MPEYLVTLKWSVRYTYKVTADSADHAERVALDVWAEDPMDSRLWRGSLEIPRNEEPHHVEVVRSV